MSKTKAISPTGEEITQELKLLKKKFPSTHKLFILEKSDENRPIEAMIVTNPTAPSIHKQNTYILAGRHGNEESGRAQAMALLNWLGTKAAARTLQKQRLIVLPNLNPDAAAHETYERPDGTNVCNDIDQKKPCPETRAYLAILEKYEPDAMIDLHARGHSGYSHDMVIHPGLKDYTNDHIIMADIINNMCQAGERAGSIHISHPLTWPGWISNSPVVQCYNKYKALTVLTESSEHNTESLSLKHRSKVGLARIISFLKHGNQKHPQNHFEEYPFFCIAGFPNAAIVPRGKTAQARRRSRIDTWQNLHHFKAINASIPSLKKEKKLEMQYSGPTLKAGLGHQFRFPGKMKIERVICQGKKQKQSATNGYVTWQDKISTYVIVYQAIIKKGTTSIKITFQ